MPDKIKASAYVQGNRLCILGVIQTALGPIPFSHVQSCESENGPVNFGKELAPNVQAALDNSQKAIMSKVEKEKIRLAMQELVDRTNNGDQNAAANLVLVKKNAEAGYPRAIYSYKCGMQYANNQQKKTVPKVLAKEIANSEPMHVQTAVNGFLPGVKGIELAVTLANGPKLDNTRIKSLTANYDNEEKRDFLKNFKNWKTGKANTQAAKIGKCVGLAQAIQMVRLPDTSVSVLDSNAAWELE